MEQKDLLALKRTTSTIGKVLEIKADNGYVITEYKNGADISTYYGFTTAHMPILDTYPNYRVITKEKADKLQMEKDKLIERDLWK